MLCYKHYTRLKIILIIIEMDYEHIFKDFITTEKVNGSYHLNISDLNDEMDMYKKRIDTLETSIYTYSHQIIRSADNINFQVEADKLLDKYNKAILSLRELRNTYKDYTYKDWCIMYDLLEDTYENSDSDNIIG